MHLLLTRWRHAFKIHWTESLKSKNIPAMTLGPNLFKKWSIHRSPNDRVLLFLITAQLQLQIKLARDTFELIMEFLGEKYRLKIFFFLMCCSIRTWVKTKNQYRWFWKVSLRFLELLWWMKFDLLTQAQCSMYSFIVQEI